MTTAPLPVAVRIFPGWAGEAAQARRWVRALATAACAGAAEDAELVAGELVANAVQHTRSGDDGGLVTVAVTADGAIHVHDLGTGSTPCAGVPATPAAVSLLEAGGRGLLIVAALTGGYQCTPAAQCAATGPGDPAAQAGGCCISCRPSAWTPRQVQDFTAIKNLSGVPASRPPAEGAGPEGVAVRACSCAPRPGQPGT